MCRMVLSNVFTYIIVTQLVNTNHAVAYVFNDRNTLVRNDMNDYHFPIEEHYLENVQSSGGFGLRGVINGHTNNMCGCFNNYPGQRDYYQHAQLWFTQTLVRPSQPERTEVFALDTVIASSRNGWRRCQVSNGYRFGCNFNEVAICATIGRWISFGTSCGGGQQQTEGWFRPPTHTYSNIDR